MEKTPVIDRFTEFAMLDFEASGLDPQGWPIEIGLSWITDHGAVETWASLIRPDPGWSTAHWSEPSADVHGIPPEALAEAPPAADVAREMLARSEGRVVLSDAPDFEQRWLDRLLGTIGRAGAITVRDYDMATFRLFEGSLRLDSVYDHLARHPAPHRAGPDSRRLAAAWRAAANG